MIYSVGHSNRTLEFFIGLLLGYQIKRLVDIRTIPKSRFNPHFAGDSLAQNLQKVGIAYTHMKGLGGLRRPAPDSVNGAWKNSSFRGYADYMQTAEFTEHLEALKALGEKETIAMMCAEAVPWRCHRSLVADALTVRGVDVYHMMSRTTASRHELTNIARAQGSRLTYPAAQLSFE